MRGTAIEMKRSRNSYMRPRAASTAQAIACPSRRLKFAIAFFARVVTGCCPVMPPATRPRLEPLGFLDASPCRR